jgi:hypothetical protein
MQLIEQRTFDGIEAGKATGQMPAPAADVDAKTGKGEQ